MCWQKKVEWLACFDVSGEGQVPAAILSFPSHHQLTKMYQCANASGTIDAKPKAPWCSACDWERSL
jgi:hypothetical protein